MSTGKITEKQKQILDFVKEEVINRGYPPAVREICKAVGLKSTSSVHAHLETLEQKGYIRRDPTKPRAIEVIDDACIENYFPFPTSMLSNAKTFMLHVQGESMINAGICDGDFVLVEKRKTAHDGDIVAVMVDGSATVKTFYKEKNRIRLQPENDTMEPVFLEKVTILGKVIGLFRMFP